MLCMILLAGLGAGLFAAPGAALPPPLPEVVAQADHPAYHRPTTRAFNSEMRKRSNLSRERARAGAEHARKARLGH